ncbi:NAD(P)/FAD-dependent oxidoreductase [Oceanobacillus halophilus]|uniref:FAD-dependent oxidoreductase n=1 Tax=Oceanobacillus halophilus TaxID=930130 RepID=A0A495AE96_9BACI|nr:FAD-dependent oxidoreductase [Oceanobacillus halophilus]RKQ37265.1 FAD-dependent oxidoreductase [Oceanobacillus halophilus]
MNFDLVIIGAGPAGMSAAIKAAENGVSVAIIDENPEVGGKLLGQLYKDSKSGWWIGQKIADELGKKLTDLNIAFFLEEQVCGIFPRWEVLLSSGERLHGKYIIIATGAAEKALPIPGWTLPGVMAIGAAQMLTNYHRVKPGEKIAIIGIDPLSLTIAYDMRLAGIHVVGIYLPKKSEFSHMKAEPKQLISYLSNFVHVLPNPFLKLFGKMLKYPVIQNLAITYYPSFGIKVFGVPLHIRKAVVEIVGENQVDAIKVEKVDKNGSANGKMEEVTVDCVCISGGLYPLGEIARVAGCEFAYLEEVGGYVPLHNENLETTQAGIFTAGNITGIEGANVAIEQGNLVGLVISDRLGLLKNSKEIIKAKKKVLLAREEAVISFQPQIEIGKEKIAELWNKRMNE